MTQTMAKTKKSRAKKPLKDGGRRQKTTETMKTITKICRNSRVSEYIRD